MKIPDSIHIEGDLNYRGECPKEGAEHVTFVNWMRAQYPDTYGKLLVHQKGEGKRTHRQVQIDKAYGAITKGCADFLVMCTPPIAIELKRRDHTKSALSGDQIEFLKLVESKGGHACVALGWESAREFFTRCIDTKS